MHNRMIPVEMADDGIYFTFCFAFDREHVCHSFLTSCFFNTWKLIKYYHKNLIKKTVCDDACLG